MSNGISRRSFAGISAIAATLAAAPLAFAAHGGHGGHDDGEHGTSRPSSGSSSGAGGTAAYVLADGDAIAGGSYVATETDQSVFAACDDVAATIDDALIRKGAGGASSAEGSSFYGVNAAVRVYGDACVTMNGCIVEADADDATGVFAYQNGRIEIADSTVTVTGGGAGGVQVAGGGTLIGRNLTVTSASKAAIRSDRGGGTLDLTGGTYTSTGSNGCPAIYSTAGIVVRDAECLSQNSRAVIIEGGNSVTVENCDLAGNDRSTKEGGVRANVLLYQSASGDASAGTGVFTMNGGHMACAIGAMFYCTNTASIVNLTGADLDLSPDGSLLIAGSGRWGKEGSNGGDCTVNAADQVLEGTVVVDGASCLTLNLVEGSTFSGSINSGGAAGSVHVSIDETSAWSLTADSYIEAFDGDLACIDAAGFALFIGGEQVL